MTQKPLFNLSTLLRNNSDVFIVLPDISLITIETLSVCLEFTKKYKKLFFLCSEFEIDFYKLLLNKSKSFSQFKDKIFFDTTSHVKLKEIQLKDCIIINLNQQQLMVESAKRAILCFPSEESDVIFSDKENKDDLTNINYLRHLLRFLMINEEKLLKNIELNSKDVVESSKVASNYMNKKFSVIYIKDMVSYLKIVNFLKKNSLKKHLIIISKNPIGITDSKLLTLNNYSFLDSFSFMLQADSIACTKNSLDKSILSNLRINLSVFTQFKEYSSLLYDISEPKKNIK